MPEKITFQVRRPTERDPGEVATAHYIIEGDMVVLTDPYGRPIGRAGGDQFKMRLTNGADVRSLATVLAKEQWHSRINKDFGRRLDYSRHGTII